MKITLKRANVKEPVQTCGLGGKQLDTEKIEGLKLTYLPDAQMVLVERPGFPPSGFHASSLRNFILSDPSELDASVNPAPKRRTKKTGRTPRFVAPKSAEAN